MILLSGGSRWLSLVAATGREFSIAHPSGEMSTSDEPRRGEAHTTLDARRRQAIDLDDRHEPFIKKREDL
jgi:hypothetical protein